MSIDRCLGGFGMMRSGTTLGGRYVLVRAIARGGMGEVWQADDTVLGRVVAIKLLLSTLSSDSDFASRFRSEARAMASLSHPGIVEVYDYGDSDGLPYLVMQYVAGQSLRALLDRDGRLSPARTMTLVSQAAEALHHAHSAGIIHRDVKPGNLLIRPDGRLVLTDFGIARILAADLPTTTGQVVGTAAYLSPEQVLGTPVSPATDMYALGIVAYECLTRHRPFVADTAVAVALMHTRTSPPPLPSDIPVAVRDVVLRALAKDPALRWARAGDMADAATEAAAVAGSADAVTRTAEVRLSGPGDESTTLRSGSALPPRRHRVLALTAGATAVAAAVGLTALVALHPQVPGPELVPGAVARLGSSRTPGPYLPGAASGTVAPTATDAATPASTPSVDPPGPIADPPATAGAPPIPGAAVPHHTAPDSSAPPTTTSPPPSTVAVPAVLHQQVQYAESVIQDAGLVPQVQYQLLNSDCTVLQETPVADTSVAPGSAVTLLVDADANGLCTGEPLPP